MLRKINRPLIDWYQKNRRDLPWREKAEPYHVWVSEIMLQQTRVEAVREYYRRFLQLFPTIADLAEAEEEKLLKAWEGLGYYNRVRNMQRAAQMVVAEFGGNLPADYEKLLSLPGIGSYTAGAIASIAYQIPVPAVDGNVLRVIMRISDSDADIAKASVKKQVEEALAKTMDREHPGTYNQALMELGAVICVPNGMPKCEQCPVAHLCRGYQNGTALALPVKTGKKRRRIEKKTVFLIMDGSSAVIHKRDGKGLLAGLYELPNTDGWLEEQQALDWIKQEGFQALHIQRLPDAKHIFSHVEWHMRAYRVKACEMAKEKRKTEKKGAEKEPFFVVEKDRIRNEIPIPSAFSAYREYIWQS